MQNEGKSEHEQAFVIRSGNMLSPRGCPYPSFEQVSPSTAAFRTVRLQVTRNQLLKNQEQIEHALSSC